MKFSVRNSAEFKLNDIIPDATSIEIGPTASTEDNCIRTFMNQCATIQRNTAVMADAAIRVEEIHNEFITLAIGGFHHNTDYGLKFLIESTNKDFLDTKAQLMKLRAEAADSMTNRHNEVQATIHLTNQLIVKFTEVCDDYRNAQTRFQFSLTHTLIDQTKYGLKPSNESALSSQKSALQLLEKSLNCMKESSLEAIVLVEFYPGKSSADIPDTHHRKTEWIKRIVVGSVAVTIVIIIITKVLHLSI